MSIDSCDSFQVLIPHFPGVMEIMTVMMHQMRLTVKKSLFLNHTSMSLHHHHQIKKNILLR